MMPLWQQIDSEVYRGLLDGSDAWRNSLTHSIAMLDECRESDGEVWRHFSLSHPFRLPTWNEFVEAKEKFLGVESLAIQILPPRQLWVNLHPFCLHLWQPIEKEIIPESILNRGNAL